MKFFVENYILWRRLFEQNYLQVQYICRFLSRISYHLPVRFFFGDAVAYLTFV